MKALLLAVETGSISAAARKLGKKQPQVSQWISDLEIDLGVDFFDRTGNRTKLSEEGERLLPYLKHTMSQFDKFVQSAEMLLQGEPTVLTIGVENYIPDGAFTRPLALTLEIPHLSVEVYREDKHQLMHDLENGLVDIIITHESETLHYQGFEYCRLGYYQDMLVCGLKHPLAALPVVTTSDLSQYRELIWGESHKKVTEQYENDFSDGFSPFYGVFSDIQPLISMLKHNQGFAFLPEEYVANSVEYGQLLPLRCDFEPASIVRRIELCWRNGLILSPHISTVVNAFKTEHQLTE